MTRSSASGRDHQDESHDPLRELWDRLGRPLNVIGAVGALLGLPQGVTRQFVGAMLATSDEAEDLLDAMPMTLRSLSISTVVRPERSVGEVRGPILWNETMSARSASGGDPGIFITASPGRAYDTDENYVLVGALRAIHRSGRDVDRVSASTYDDELLRRARHNGARAAQFLGHRSLASLADVRPSRRHIHRTRAGNRRSIYAPALAMLARAEEPITVDHLLPFCDERTVAQHDLVAAVVRRLEALGFALPSFWVDQGALHAGPVHYRHTHLRGDVGMFTGVRVGQVLMDVPESLQSRDPEAARRQLQDRAGDVYEVVPVLSRADVNRGVELAVRLGLDGF